MKRITLAIILCLSLPGTGAYAQEYKAPPVTISTQTVKQGGKLYYSHVVESRQTLFSIAKAYGVTIQDIYDANQALDLQNIGLKKNQIILIPVKQAEQPVSVSEEVPQAEVPAKAVADATVLLPIPAAIDTTYHIVKWYDDLSGIARKYNVTREEIMAVNNMTDTTVTKGKRIIIPVKVSQAPDTLITTTPAIDTTAIASRDSIVRKMELAAVLVLPFNGGADGSIGMFDFYDGVLMAVKALKDEGIAVNLSAIDCAAGTQPDEIDYSPYDLVIGPVTYEDLDKTLSICPNNITVVSPLDSRVEAGLNAEQGSLVSKYPNLLHAPCPVEYQTTDMVSWLSSEIKDGDRVFVLAEEGKDMPDTGVQAIADLEAAGISYKLLKYSIAVGRKAFNAEVASGTFTKDGTNRFIIASKAGAFTQDAMRNINTIRRRFPSCVYGVARTRSLENVDVTHFHNTDLRASVSYFVNYNEFDVKDFVLTYRALFGAEPNQYSFSGYDIAYNLLKMMSLYGDQWLDVACSVKRTGLQSDFLLTHKSGEGYVNAGIRRLVYGPNYTIQVL